MTDDPRPPGPRGWKCDPDFAGTEIHIRPRGDHMWHTPDTGCACGPVVTAIDQGDPYGYVVVHHALDGRGKPPAGTFAPTPGPCPTRDRDDDEGGLYA